MRSSMWASSSISEQFVEPLIRSSRVNCISSWNKSAIADSEEMFSLASNVFEMVSFSDPLFPFEHAAQIDKNSPNRINDLIESVRKTSILFAQ